MDSRALVSISVGVTGFILGVLSLFNGNLIGLFAGVAALGAGLAGLNIGRQLVKAEEILANERTQAASLEEAVSSQVQARMTAEETVRSLGSELAATQARASEQSERIEADAHDAGLFSSGSGRDVIIDEETGLYTEAYFRAAVKARVVAARRHLRPVSIILMEVTSGSEQEGRAPADSALVSECILETLRESDTACTTRKGLYALVLEDTPENGAVWTVERIRRRLAEDDDNLTMWAGVACYPAHAFETRDLVGKASEALKSATEWHQDRIEVALPDL